MATAELPTAPANWWLTTAPYERDGYLPPAFVKTSSGNFMHGLFSGVRTTNFDTTDEYYEGIGTGAGIMLGIGLVLLILYPVVSWLLRKPGCCKSSKAKRPGSAGALLIFTLFWLAALAGTCLGLYGLISFYKQVDQVGTNVGLISDRLAYISNLGTQVDAVSNGLSGGLNTALTAIGTCVAAAAPAYPLDFTALGGTLAQIQEELGVINGNEQLENAKVKTNDISNDIENSQAWRIVIIVVLAALMVLSLVLLAVFTARAVSRGSRHNTVVKRSRKSSCLVWTATTLVALTAVIMWIFLSAFSAVGMVGGDFCQQPDAEVLQLAEDNELISFYVSCTGGTPVSNALIRAQQLLLGAVTGLDETLTAAAAAAPGCAPIIGASLQGVSNTSYYANGLAVDGLNNLACSTINPLYTEAVHDTVCNDALHSAQFVLLGAFMVTIGLLVASLAYNFIAGQARAANAGKTLLGPSSAASGNGAHAPLSTVGNGYVAHSGTNMNGTGAPRRVMTDVNSDEGRV